MKILLKIDSIIEKIMKALLVISMLVMSAILIANVFYRLILKSSIISAEEIGNYAVIIVIFIGMVLTAKENKHVRISSLLDIMPHKVQKISATIISFLTSATVFYIAYYVYEYMSYQMRTGRVSAALKLPVYYVSLVVLIGFILTGVEYFVQFIINLANRDEVYLGRTPYMPELASETEKTIEKKEEK